MNDGKKRQDKIDELVKKKDEDFIGNYFDQENSGEDEFEKLRKSRDRILSRTSEVKEDVMQEAKKNRENAQKNLEKTKAQVVPAANLDDTAKEFIEAIT